MTRFNNSLQRYLTEVVEPDYDAPRIHHMVDSDPSAGKTYQAIAVISATQKQKGSVNILYAVPTLILQNEIVTRLKGADVPEDKITVHSYTQGKAVTQRALASIQATPPNSGAVHLITHSTLMEVAPDMTKRGHWFLFVDELPPILTTVTLTDDGKASATLSSYMEQFDSSDPDNVVSASEQAHRNLMQTIDPQAATSTAKTAPSYIELCKAVLDRNKQVKLQKITSDVAKFKIVTLPDVLLYFQCTIIMSAKFTWSDVYYLWTNRDIEFIPFDFRGKLLKDRLTQHRKSVRFHYLVAKGDWSVTRHTSDYGLVRRVLEHIADSLPEKRLLALNAYKTGNDPDGTHSEYYWHTDGNADLLPGATYGIDRDDWKAVNNVVYLPAMLHSSDELKFLAKEGMDSEAAFKSRQGSHALQTIHRCSLRTDDTVSIKTIVVGSKRLAVLLADLYGASAPTQFPGISEVLGSANKPATAGRKPAALPRSVREKIARARAKLAGGGKLNKNQHALLLEHGIIKQESLGRSQI